MKKQKQEIELKIGKVILFFLLGILTLILIIGSIVTVPAGYRGVQLTFGKPNLNELNEGLHFKIPIAQKVEKLEVRTQKVETKADSSSKDLQDVQTTIALNFHVSETQAAELYQKIGNSYGPRIIDPAIQETIKAVSARYTAEELISKRATVRNEVQNELKERLAKSFIIVDDFNIVDFQFSEEFDKAIEAKVTAEQLKLKAERDLERIVIEKQQKITQAQAEAEALRLQKQEITPELIQLRSIEVQRSAIEKWDGILPQVTGGAMPFLDVMNINQGQSKVE